MRVLVVGATGLLGNTVFRVLAERGELDVTGTCRSDADRRLFSDEVARQLLITGNLESLDELNRIFDRAAPDLVVNCVGGRRLEPLQLERALSLYSVLPKRLSHLSRLAGARLVHISSDGVFTGVRGGYTENDMPDSTDIYGTAKLLGELAEPHAVTLRTSMIGPDPKGRSGLLEWFLATQGECKCYSRAIFSGLPTVEIGRIIGEFVIPRPELSGVYHVAAEAISKHELLKIVARQYGKEVELIPDQRVVIDRSLSGARFHAATSYAADSWPALVRRMHSFRYGLAD